MTENTKDHSRDKAGLTYVYPVVSRRSRGVSIGINLNPNNACNWRCVYCQVEGLQRGAAPLLDLDLLRRELDGFLSEVLDGDWMERFAPPEARRLNDIAFSGNGESTTSHQFAEAVEVVAKGMERHGLAGEGVGKESETATGVRLVLITNGSMVHKTQVQKGLARMAECNGEVWFKVDGGRESDRMAINDVPISNSKVASNLRTCAALVSTRIQTCMFSRSGEPPSEEVVQAYLDFLGAQLQAQVPIQDVMLYGLARPSFQPEAVELGVLPEGWLKKMKGRIAALGVAVNAYDEDGILAE